MDPNRRAIAFWIVRVAIAVLLVILLQAWRGPNPVLWYAAAAYALIAGLITLILIRRSAKGSDAAATRDIPDEDPSDHS
ncbi:hypothetical protein N9W17_01290 [Jannaschia sp.]|nr:hypothetical protein [Jannaschia sp.]